MIFLSFKNKFLSFLKKIQKETLQIGIVVVAVLLLTWGISIATTDDYESATDNFSVIGTVASISDNVISLTHARGTDTTEQELYNLDIRHLDKVETKNYEPLIISDVKPGDTIIAQGLTNGSVFFIKRIISFAGTPLPVQTDNATTTPDMATSTIELDGTTETSTVGTTSNEVIGDGGVVSDSVEEIDSGLTQEILSTEASATTTVINTMTEILEDGINNVTDVLETILDITTPVQEQDEGGASEVIDSGVAEGDSVEL